MSTRIEVEHIDSIADVKLARPDKLNAMDTDMFTSIIDTAKSINDDPSIRVVVLSGQGKGFCAGLDVESIMPELTEAGSLLAESDESPANFVQRSAWIWREIRVPVIAAVHGPAFGAGLQLALGADIRIVAPDARLSLREIHWGLIPDIAVTQTVRHTVPLDVAKELSFTGREVSGEEAVGLRLATSVSENPHAAAMDLAREIAGRSPDAVQRCKALWNRAPYASVSEGLAMEAALQKELIGGVNQQEAVFANIQKRQPKFQDPNLG